MGETRHGINNTKPSAPPSGKFSIYPKADGYYIQDSGGNESKIAIEGFQNNTGKLVSSEFFTNLFTFTNNTPTFVTVYSHLSEALAIGTYIVEWILTYVPSATNNNDIFVIAEGATPLATQIDMDSEGKDVGSDIKDPRTIAGELVVTAAGQKTITLRGAQRGDGTTVVKGALVKITRKS